MRHDGKPFIQRFIVEGRYLGEGRRTFDKRGMVPSAPVSYAFFCPVCAEVWARCPVSLPDSEKYQPFQVLTANCRKCRTNNVFKVPGELTCSWDHEFVEAFPQEVLQRELMLLLDLYQEGIEK